MDEVKITTPEQANSNVKSTIYGAIPDGALGDDEREVSPRSAADNNKAGPNGTDRESVNGIDRQISGGSESGKDGRKGKRGRRKRKGGKHHQWKPYNKLSWEERKKIDEKETKKACAKRQRRFESGHPVAPYNTTQFLMDDHDKNEHIEPNLENRAEELHRQGSGSYESSEEYYGDSPNDDMDDSFLVKDFSEAYESIHAERLQNMNKSELIKEYIELESKVEKLEQQLKIVEENKINRNHLIERNTENVEHWQKDACIQKLKAEINNLQSENILLAQEKLMKSTS